MVEDELGLDGPLLDSMTGPLWADPLFPLCTFIHCILQYLIITKWWITYFPTKCIEVRFVDSLVPSSGVHLYTTAACVPSFIPSNFCIFKCWSGWRIGWASGEELWTGQQSLTVTANHSRSCLRTCRQLHSWPACCWSQRGNTQRKSMWVHRDNVRCPYGKGHSGVQIWVCMIDRF